MAEQQNPEKGKKKNRKRGAEILGIFAKHNFYSNGFTPVELRTTLEDLGPTYVKIGQIMSSRTDMLPKEYCRELEKLRSTVKPLPSELAREVIEEETGKTIDEIYSEFRDEPLGSASIGQAHYGVLKDGTRVVTKVQRPGIADMMREDFVLLKKLAGMVSMSAEDDDEVETIDLKGILEELEKVTWEELDFRVEAQNTRLFHELCIEDDAVVSCPRIIDELTTERILTMTFVDGYSLSHKERLEEDGYDRLEIGKALTNNYLHQVLDQCRAGDGDSKGKTQQEPADGRSGEHQFPLYVILQPEGYGCRKADDGTDGSSERAPYRRFHRVYDADPQPCHDGRRAGSALPRA